MFPWFSHGFPMVFPTASPISQELCEVTGIGSEKLSAQLGGEAMALGPRKPWENHRKTMGKPWADLTYLTQEKCGKDRENV